MRISRKHSKSYIFSKDSDTTTPLNISFNNRTYCVSVRFNEKELKIINSKRGEISKGKWLRLLALEKKYTSHTHHKFECLEFTDNHSTKFK